MTTNQPTEEQRQEIQRKKGLVLIERYVPPRYREATTENQAALDWIRSPRGVLYLFGPTGTGKSHTAWAILRKYLFSDLRHNRYGPFTGGDLTTLLAAMDWRQISDDVRGGVQDPRERAAHGPLLFLDDLGATKLIDWELKILVSILETRYNEMRPTIIASNLMPGDELAELVGERIVSRIAEEHTLVPLIGDDRRRS